ncbi:MAG: ArsC family reductase [Gammaproteobacteria bacterium]|nr:ArsC family reductase [Gammaproteobacteria bacterium]MCW8986666.1 ArsC family reductase [Gammaproteobacteria bacterium]
MLKLYGIKNCDTVKKARRWLENHGVDYQFHDFRQDGLDKKQLTAWVEKLGWESILNKRSTTWRSLSDEEKNISSNSQAIKLLLTNPTLIKRPIAQNSNVLLIGFKDVDYKNI